MEQDENKLQDTEDTIDESKSVAYFKHHLGVMAKDRVTGFQGVITGRLEHLFGCNTYGLTPKVDKDGKTQDSHWFDEGRLEILGPGVEPETVRVQKNGAGDCPHIS